MDGAAAGPARGPRGVTIIFALVALCIVITTAFAPISIQPNGAFDDGLFITLGRRFAYGNWFGTYSHLTLHKGNGYSVFLALASWLGLPVTLAHGLFQAAACTTFAAVVGRIGGSWRLAVAVLLALAMVPVLGTTAALRVLRDAIYSGQTLLVLSAVLWLLHRSREAGTPGRGLLAGILLAWMWLTREEGVWILPAIFLLVLGYPLPRPADGAPWRARVKGVLLATLWLAVGFALVDVAYRAANRLAYGTWTTVAIKEASFERALGALYSVEDGETVPYVPVSRATRQRIYAVSPAFAALKPFIDPPGPPIWTNGCPFYATGCNDIAGGWFHVTFLFAVRGLGSHGTLEEAKAYYARVADEVEAACADGRLTCRRTLHNAIPRLAPDLVETLPARILAMLGRVTLAQAGSVFAAPSTGTAPEIAEALIFLNAPPHVPSAERPQAVVVEAQFTGAGTAPIEVRMLGDAGAALPTQVERLPPPEGRPTPPPPGEQLIRVTTACALPACELEVTQDGATLARVRLWDLVTIGARFPTHMGTFRITKLIADGVNLIGDVRLRASHLVRSMLVAAVPYILPPLAVAGLVAGLAGLAMAAMARQLPPTLLVALALGASVAARVAIFVIGDAAGLPVNEAYIAPANFLCAAAAVLALHGAWSAAQALRARRSRLMR
ncbi:hypothetical protein [Azorhizobium doebereinerae]|uniref:hypothetical protein n=1 Tax=Azorhizobium doebereinerae TaxID=281091 RepID=UPI00041C7D6B|nr:hypothetical protein [Azorhizobium doebereinerae]